mgnify:CR=1 FL=1
MFTDFYDMTCSVWTEVSTMSRGSSKLTKNVKYTSIPCYFESSNNSMNWDQSLARETDKDRYVVYLPITYNNILKWEIVQLFDVNSNSVGEYIVDFVDVHSLSGCSDVSGVSLQVSNR